ncbi:MAG TPA: hypothetical protein VM327_03240 [Candidatus Thermoplasmatota archaeon]|nr:hypothetical protein [Candidatus Thermoplasmatota archaeon]
MGEGKYPSRNLGALAAARTPKVREDVAAFWPGMHRVKAFIPAEATYYHHHAEQVARFNPGILDDVRAAVAQVSSALALERKRRGEPRGLDPAHFNDQLRRGFAAVNSQHDRGRPGWTFEARIKDGVVWDHATHEKAKVDGFDVACYDAAHNCAAVRNLCFGRRALDDGAEVWRKCRASFAHWTPYLDSVPQGKAGEDITVAKSEPTVIGEIQCGNWALVHRDFMKLLQAERELAKIGDELDMFVYICPTGTLSNYMSGGTVSFAKTVEYLQHFRAVITVPTVVIGVDVRIDSAGADRTGLVSEDLKRKLRARVTVNPLIEEVAPALVEPTDGDGISDDP